MTYSRDLVRLAQKGAGVICKTSKIALRPFAQFAQKGASPSMLITSASFMSTPYGSLVLVQFEYLLFTVTLTLSCTLTLTLTLGVYNSRSLLQPYLNRLHFVLCILHKRGG